ncbi:glycerate kinase [Demequina sediminicola]|uniref:glycerate kinase n=1 Tax=Demequina sediminicola TaxID=1095026 RepID=UPI000780C9D6|nr:glycerate kinase [Demequina sediminicola]
MHALLLTDGWPHEQGLAGADAVAAVASSCWSATRPLDTVASIALGDGGPRSADVLSDLEQIAPGVDGARVGSTLVLAPADSSSRWDPRALGEALVALARQSTRTETSIVIPVGDTDPAGDATQLWAQTSAAELRNACMTLPIEVLVTSDKPLLGLKGMSSVLRDGREADAAIALAAQHQERRWSDIAREVDALAPANLLGPARLSDAPGTGCATGLAYCLAGVGAKVNRASARLAEISGASHEAADFVLAITPEVTPAQLDHGIAAAASSLAARRGVPCAILSPQVWVGRRDLMAAGVVAAHEGTPGMDHLADHVVRVCHTWSPASNA